MTKRFNRGDRKGVLYYLTINIRDHKLILRTDAYAREVLCCLRQHCNEHPARLIAYVAMPDHLHAILNLKDWLLTRFLSQFKPAATLALLDVARSIDDRTMEQWLHFTADGDPQLWQDGKHSLDLYSEWMIWQKIHYIHNNPIRKELVKQANEYPYSSFVDFYQTEGISVVPVDRGFWWEDDSVEIR